MCVVDLDGGSEVWRESEQRARKVYRCYSCGALVLPGETYRRIFSVYEGDASDMPICEICSAASDAFCEAHDLGGMSDVRSFVQDCASDGDYPRTEDPWRYWLFLIDLNERRSQWEFAHRVAQSFAVTP
jgi:hypothetical protein